MYIALQLLVAVVGLLMWFVSANPKLQKVGEYLFFCGVLTFLLVGANPMIQFLTGTKG